MCITMLLPPMPPTLLSKLFLQNLEYLENQTLVGPGFEWHLKTGPEFRQLYKSLGTLPFVIWTLKSPVFRSVWILGV